MLKEQAQETLDLYKENEDLNLHSDNYLLLANAFDDDDAIKKAERNLQNVNWRPKPSLINQENARLEAHEACNHYYYQLKRIINK